jgi:hypothetical protein
MTWRSTVLAVTAFVASAQTPAADLSGRWKLAEQETSAWRGRSSTGAHNEDQIITQSREELAVHYEPGDGTWDFAYALVPAGSRVGTDDRWTSAHWEGRTLKITGKRDFKTSEGRKSCEFEETRTLSDDGTRMTVVTRIKMFPKDLVRTSVFERVDTAPVPASGSGAAG